MKIEFSKRIFEKYSNTKFHENLSGGSRVVPRGWTDGRNNRHGEPRSRFPKFCERAWKPKASKYMSHLYIVCTKGSKFDFVFPT